jgi:AcrR family transcriptional regulator
LTKKTKRDWLVAGTKLLTEVGPQGLTIDALCQQLKVTKGSFYHHYDNYEVFESSLLTFYEHEGTLQIIDQLADLPSPKEKLHHLLDIIAAISMTEIISSEVAIRAWALQDKAVREVQERIDQRRISYVQMLCEKITGDGQQAIIMSQMLYAILVGWEQMQPSLRGADLRTLFDEYLRFYQLI